MGFKSQPKGQIIVMTTIKQKLKNKLCPVCILQMAIRGLKKKNRKNY